MFNIFSQTIVAVECVTQITPHYLLLLQFQQPNMVTVTVRNFICVVLWCNC